MIALYVGIATCLILICCVILMAQGNPAPIRMIKWAIAGTLGFLLFFVRELSEENQKRQAVTGGFGLGALQSMGKSVMNQVKAKGEVYANQAMDAAKVEAQKLQDQGMKKLEEAKVQAAAQAQAQALQAQASTQAQALKAQAAQAQAQAMAQAQAAQAQAQAMAQTGLAQAQQVATDLGGDVVAKMRAHASNAIATLQKRFEAVENVMVNAEHQQKIRAHVTALFSKPELAQLGDTRVAQEHVYQMGLTVYRLKQQAAAFMGSQVVGGGQGDAELQAVSGVMTALSQIPPETLTQTVGALMTAGTNPASGAAATVGILQIILRLNPKHLMTLIGMFSKFAGIGMGGMGMGGMGMGGMGMAGMGMAGMGAMRM
jgi:hypothetical protein